MWEAIAGMAGALGATATGAGVWFVARQIRDARTSLRAQFVSQLETEITNIDGYETYTRLLPGAEWSSTEVGPQNREEISKILPYLGFFAKIKILIDIGAIDMELIDRMFAFRFFLVVHNRHVQEKILCSGLYKPYWFEVFTLHKQWLDFRLSNNRGIPFSETSLEPL